MLWITLIPLIDSPIWAPELESMSHWAWDVGDYYLCLWGWIHAKIIFLHAICHFDIQCAMQHSILTCDMLFWESDGEGRGEEKWSGQGRQWGCKEEEQMEGIALGREMDEDGNRVWELGRYCDGGMREVGRNWKRWRESKGCGAGVCGGEKRGAMEDVRRRWDTSKYIAIYRLEELKTINRRNLKDNGNCFRVYFLTYCRSNLVCIFPPVPCSGDKYCIRNLWLGSDI